MRYENLKKHLKNSLTEDLNNIGDISSILTISKNKKVKANIIAKQTGKLSGGSLIKYLIENFSSLICTLHFLDGSNIEKNNIILSLEGEALEILKLERTCLNYLQHLSGIATLTAKYAQISSIHNVTILDTRKTIPGLRQLEKKAVTDGGGKNHRFGLYDAILLKENHIKASGGINKAIYQILKSPIYSDLKVNKKFFLEVEASSFKEAKECCLHESISRIMLDNMSPQEAKKCINYIRNNSSKKEIEISGNINLNTIETMASLKPDFISVGELTHSAPAFDFSLLIL